MLVVDSLAGAVALAALAMLVELVIEALKPLLDPFFALLRLPETVQPYLYVGSLLGAAVCVLWQVDLATVVGLPAVNRTATLAAQIATGFIVGRGSNITHDAYARLLAVLGKEAAR